MAARFGRIVRLCYRHLCTLRGVGRFFLWLFTPASFVELGRDGEAGLDSLGPRLYKPVRRIGSSVNGSIGTCLVPSSTAPVGWRSLLTPMAQPSGGEAPLRSMNFGVNFRFRIRGARDRAYAETVAVFRCALSGWRFNSAVCASPEQAQPRTEKERDKIRGARRFTSVGGSGIP